MSAVHVPGGHTLAELIACVDREIALRYSCYPRWVRAGSLAQADASRELTAMRAVRAVLEQLGPAAEPSKQGSLFEGLKP